MPLARAGVRLLQKTGKHFGPLKFTFCQTLEEVDLRDEMRLCPAQV